MLKWRTLVAASARACSAASGAVAAVVLVYRSLSKKKREMKKKNCKAALVLRFDLLNMLLTDMDVGETVLGKGSKAATRLA